jgi:hypothetical protein
MHLLSVAIFLDLTLERGRPNTRLKQLVAPVAAVIVENLYRSM